jgi:LuxR family maltose regulon positive regulatory protein
MSWKSLPLVEAKLQPPTVRRPTIDRPRLVDPLLAQDGPRVVAVVAPPGYGKTTLLTQWRARETRPVAWLTLDNIDNDPASLLSYLAAAFDRIVPIDASIRSAIASPRQRILATAVPRLASELYRWERPAVLVLDDVHHLVDRTALDALAALLDHLPPGFRVAMAGRTEPDLPLARFRAAGDLLEVGATLLALEEQETAALAELDAHPLTREEARELTARTEGWVTGVRLAAGALARGQVTSGSLPAISGRDRHLEAYIRSEFGRTLAGDDVAVLTRTSILETITPGAAEAVSGISDAWARLSTLARGSLLIQDVGVAEPAFRYHTLIREFLGGELDRREPEARPELHGRAAAWFAAAGDTGQAVEHSIAGGDVDGAARVVTGVAVPAFYAGHGRTLDRWLQRFDDAAFDRHPPLAVIAGWIHLLNGRPEPADQMADVADRATFVGSPGDGSASFESQRAMLRAVMARHGPADMLANAELAVAQEQPDSPWRANALYLLGAARLVLGEVDAADEALAASIPAGPRSGSSVARAKRSSIAMARGDWREAERFARESLDVVTMAHYEEIGASLITYAVSARVAIHRGDLAQGREHLVRAQLVRPLLSYAWPCFSVDALLEVARAYLALSDPAGAQVVLREAEQIVRRRPALGVLTTDLVAMRRRLADAKSTLAGSSTLTTAELRVLPLLSTYLPFQEIADRLMVSRNTVKTQAMSIYGKLQASSRSEAVERAVELGLLEPFPGLALARGPAPEWRASGRPPG